MQEGDHPHIPTVLPMKHLDSIDGVVGAVPIAERPPTSMLGDNIELLILRLKMPDAETWIAHTATKRVLQRPSARGGTDTRLPADLQWTPTLHAVFIYHI